MKQNLLFFAFLFVATTFSFGQRAQTVYVELLGNGIIFSANYDTRFTNTPDGWGGKIGLGYVGSDGSSALTIPLQVNHLLGKDGKYFEIGLGATYVGGTTDNFDDFEDDLIGTMTFAYRRQPVDGGFNFRVGVTPLFDENTFWPFWFGLSLGYTW